MTCCQVLKIMPSKLNAQGCHLKKNCPRLFLLLIFLVLGSAFFSIKILIMISWGPVHMVKKGHKYVTLLQMNVPRVMILSQKHGKFI